MPTELARSEAAAGAGGAGARRAAFLVLLVAVTFGQRFCFPLGTFQIPLAVPAAYLALAILFTGGQLRVDLTGFVLYAVAIAAMVATLWFGKDGFSPFSLWYLIVLYLVWIFAVEMPEGEHRRVLAMFRSILTILAVIAVLQFLEQSLGLGTHSLLEALPRQLLLEGYNTRPVLSYGSSFHKANAEFFLEPSFVSQYMAVGIIVELIWFGSWTRMALFAGAIFASFSGTGMLLLLVFACAVAVRSQRWDLLLLVPLGLLVLVLFRDNPYVGAIVGRVGEFDADNSSAFMRFIAPNEAVRQLIGNNFEAFLVGRGPGIVDRIGGFDANFPVMHKLLIEYGMLGFLPFMGFVLWRFFGAARSGLFAAALLFMYLFLSGSLLQPHTIFLFYALSIALPAPLAARRPMPAPVRVTA